MLVSKKFWDKLSPDEQKMLQDAADRGPRLPARAAARRRKGAGRAQGQGHGVQRDRAGRVRPHAGRAKPIAEKFSADFDPAKVKLFNDELERIRKA